MHPVFEDFYDRLNALHDDIKAALDGLPAEALDWQPGPDMNSITVLVVHSMGAERYWIGDVIAQDFSGRERDEEFKAQGWPHDKLVARMDEVLAHSQAVLDNMTPADLTAVCQSPRDGRRYMAGWSLFHALEHLAQHSGHIQIMRQMWEMK